MVATFFGEFRQTIDAKHRLPICMALRERIDPEGDGENFVLVLGTKRHLWLYPEKSYLKLLETLPASPLPDRQSQHLDLMFAMARVVKPDGQGRVVLPEASMRRAVVSDEITLVGNRDHIELWPSEEYDRHVEQLMESYDDGLYDAGERARAAE
jgi:MraZ protein